MICVWLQVHIVSCTCHYMQHILNFEGLIVLIVHIIHSDNVISSEHVIDIFICNCLLGM